MGIQVYRDITVDFSNGRYIIINAKQHDSKSRFVRMTCTNVGQKVNLSPNDYSAFIRYRKPDGYGVFNKCVISTTGEIIFELTEQMLSTVGTSYADLLVINIEKPNINNDLTIISADGRIIENNSSIVSTMTFYINILEKPLEDWEITSTNKFSALNDLLSKATKDYEYIVQTTKEYMDNAKNSENSAVQFANVAKTSADNAKKSENNTAISERKAYEEAIAAFNSALLSKSYAVGESGFLTNEEWEKIITSSDDYISVESRPNEGVENAKYFYEQSKIQAQNAKKSEDNAKESEINADSSAITAKDCETNSKNSEINSKASENASKQSEINAKKSEINARDSEESVKDKMIVAFNSALLARSYANGDTSGVLTDEEWNKIVTGLEEYIPLTTRENEETDNAKYYYEQARTFANTTAEQATISTTQATNAKTFADNAKVSENASKQYKEDAERYYIISRSYVIGDTNTRENEETDNAKYYYEQLKRESENNNITELKNTISSLVEKIQKLEKNIDDLKTDFYSSTILLEVTDDDVEEEEDNAMTIPQVQEAIATVWNEESSDDETAMNREEIEYALSHTWDGNTSPDVTAMQKEEIVDIISK